LWWVDAESNQVGRLDTSSGSASLWTVPGSNGFFGTALDGAGGLWFMDYSEPNTKPFLFHLTAANQLCSYRLPDQGSSDYVVEAGSQIWLGDNVNSRILYLDTAANPNTYTWWQLAPGSFPEGMALDGSGNLWWADYNRGGLGRLQPGADLVTLYAQPQVSSTAMVAVKNERVWFSTQGATFGILDPQQNLGVTTPVTKTSQSINPSCNPLPAPSNQTIPITTGQAPWSSVQYNEVTNQNGWQIYQLPSGSYGWGITALQEIWLVDQGRQVLARIIDPVQVTACKLQDTDGDPATTADQAPKPGWTVYLRIGGV